MFNLFFFVYNNDTKVPVFRLSVKGRVSVLLASRSAKVCLPVFVRTGCVMVWTIAEITGTKALKIAVCNFDILINLLSQCLFCVLNRQTVSYSPTGSLLVRQSQNRPGGTQFSRGHRHPWPPGYGPDAMLEALCQKMKI